MRLAHALAAWTAVILPSGCGSPDERPSLPTSRESPSVDEPPAAPTPEQSNERVADVPTAPAFCLAGPDDVVRRIVAQSSYALVREEPPCFGPFRSHEAAKVSIEQFRWWPRQRGTPTALLRVETVEADLRLSVYDIAPMLVELGYTQGWHVERHPTRDAIVAPYWSTAYHGSEEPHALLILDAPSRRSHLADRTWSAASVPGRDAFVFSRQHLAATPESLATESRTLRVPASRIQRVRYGDATDDMADGPGGPRPRFFDVIHLYDLETGTEEALPLLGRHVCATNSGVFSRRELDLNGVRPRWGRAAPAHRTCAGETFMEEFLPEAWGSAAGSVAIATRDGTFGLMIVLADDAMFVLQPAHLRGAASD